MQIQLSEVETDMTLRVVYAAVLGLLIGLQRRGGNTGAGMRTFALICMGSALFTTVGITAFPEGTDTSRMAAQIVTGMGFIGAGVIWRQREEAIHGITTAAAIWVTAAIGIAAGVGQYMIAAAVSIITMLILSRGHPIKEAKENIACETVDGQKTLP